MFHKHMCPTVSEQARWAFLKLFIADLTLPLLLEDGGETFYLNFFQIFNLKITQIWKNMEFF